MSFLSVMMLFIQFILLFLSIQSLLFSLQIYKVFTDLLCHSISNLLSTDTQIDLINVRYFLTWNITVSYSGSFATSIESYQNFKKT